MNYIRHLSNFFNRVASDTRLNPTHISLYMAIFQYWNANHFRNPISVSRQDLMRLSKIAAKATYHKCIKDLHNLGYLDYQPSFNPVTGSSIFMIDFQLGRLKSEQVSTQTTPNNEPLIPESSSNAEPVQNLSQPNTEPVQNSGGTNNNPLNATEAVEQGKNTTPDQQTGRSKNEQAKSPLSNINNIINILDNIERGSSTENGTGSKNEVVVKVSKNKAKIVEINGQKVPPATLAEIKQFFLKENSTEREAQKFFNYFQSNGWKVGGRTPMKDWQAAARNWILKIPEFAPTKQTPSASQLHTQANKNYSEPL
ncbi:MAG: hypothetical protein WCX81_00015 [Monoglobales bacterium]